jgi:putative cardiolipin synthase
VVRLRRAGIPVITIGDELKPGSIASFMHHKFWVVDGQEAIVGGENVLDYEAMSNGANHLNRDEDLLIRSGPTVTDLTREFIGLWQKYAKRRDPPIDRWSTEVTAQLDTETRAGVRGPGAYARLADPTLRSAGVCRLLVQTAGAKREAIAPVLQRYVDASSQRIIMSSPTFRFTPNGHGRADQLVDSLRARARAGVQVDLLSNGIGGGRGETDTWLRRHTAIARESSHPTWSGVLFGAWRSDSRSGARSSRRYLLGLEDTPNVRTWAYFEYMHAKAALFDHSAVAVGSFNVDGHSADLNHETSIVCMDDALEQEMERRFALDLVNSVPVASRSEATPTAP